MGGFLALRDQVCTKKVGKRRRHVTGPALQAEPLEAAAEAIGELAVLFEIDVVAGGGFAFKLLAHDGDRGTSTTKLALPLAQNIRTAEIGDDLCEHVLETARPRGVAWTNDVKPSAVAHRAPCHARGAGCGPACERIGCCVHSLEFRKSVAMTLPQGKNNSKLGAATRNFTIHRVTGARPVYRTRRC